MNWTTLQILWKYGPSVKLILPVVRILIDRFGPETTKSIVDAAASQGTTIIEGAKRVLNAKEQIGLKLLGLTPEEQETVLNLKQKHSK